MRESVGKADLLANHFDGKLSGKSVDLPLTLYPSPVLPPSPLGPVRFNRLVLIGLLWWQ